MAANLDNIEFKKKIIDCYDEHEASFSKSKVSECKFKDNGELTLCTLKFDKHVNLEKIPFESNTIYFLSPHEYLLNNYIKIATEKVILVGASDDRTKIIKKANKYGVYVEGDHFSMMRINICEEEGEEYECPCLEVEANYANIQYCTFESQATEQEKQHFTVYFHTRNENEKTDAVPMFNRNDLMEGNVFRNNFVRSNGRQCDNVSFSLQKCGKVFGNTIEGMLAVFMCKRCDVFKNTIDGGDNHAIFISLPSKIINIYDNELTSKEPSSIVIKPQGDNSNKDVQNEDYDIEIKGNTINCERWPIEMNYARNVYIRSNDFSPTLENHKTNGYICLLYTSPSPRDS